MSMTIRFVRLKKSAMIVEAVEDRFEPLLRKFNVEEIDGTQVLIEMENSPRQTGRDLYKVKFMISRGELKGFVLEKSDSSFYRALSSLALSFPVNIARFKNKKKKRSIGLQRKFKNVENF